MVDQKDWQARFGTVNPMDQGPRENDPRFNIVKYYNSSDCMSSECPPELAEEQPEGFNPYDHFLAVWEEKTRGIPQRYKLNACLVRRRSPDAMINHPISPLGDASVLVGHGVYDQHGILTALYAKPSQASVERAVEEALSRLEFLTADEALLKAYTDAGMQYDEPMSNDNDISDQVPPFPGPRVIVSSYDRIPQDLLVVII